MVFKSSFVSVGPLMCICIGTDTETSERRCTHQIVMSIITSSLECYWDIFLKCIR